MEKTSNINNNQNIKDNEANSDNFKSLIGQLTHIYTKKNFNKNIIDKMKGILKKIIDCILRIKNLSKSKDFYENLQCLLQVLNNFIDNEDEDICFCILEAINDLIINEKNEEILKYIYSVKYNIKDQDNTSNILDKLISLDYENKEEKLNLQVSFMKSLVLKLDHKTIFYFYDNQINQFTILSKSLYLYDHSDNMIKAVINNILLLITKINEPSLQCYLTSFPVALFYPKIIYIFKNLISQLNFNDIGKDENINKYFEEKHEEIINTVLYINDILLCELKNINFVLINCLLNEIIFPLFNIIINSTKNVKVSIVHAIYILSFMIFHIKNEFIVDLISYFLFQENIPLIIYEKIKNYTFKEINNKFISDINKIIKFIDDADINDIEWKRNADYIKKDIGLDLSTGKVEKDNNYSFFRDFFKNFNYKKEKMVKNEIFSMIQVLLTAKDENIIINVNLLIYNVIDYYFNYFKNIKNKKDMEEDEDTIYNENSENSETLGKNKVRNSEFCNNNLKILNNNINNKSKKDSFIINDKTLFNPFLLTYFIVPDNEGKNNSNNKTIFDQLLQLIKNDKNYHICTNEIMLNIIKLLIKISFIKQQYSSRSIKNLNSLFVNYLKEEINKVKLLSNAECNNYLYYSTIAAYNYYITDTIETKVNDLLKFYYIIIPFTYFDKIDDIPISLKEDKTDYNLLRNHMIKIFLFIDIIQMINSKKIGIINMNNKNNKFGPFEVEKDSEFIIEKTYKKEELGKEYGFCYFSKTIEDFKSNFENIKKCVFILSKYNLYLGEIESNTFKDLSKIKIFTKMPLRFIKLQIFSLYNKECYIEINDIENKNKKYIINCFNPINTQKTYNYLLQMINQCISFETSIFDSFIDNIEKTFIK